MLGVGPDGALAFVAGAPHLPLRPLRGLSFYREPVGIVNPFGVSLAALGDKPPEPRCASIEVRA